jgi:hypothetical protein
MIDTKLAHRTSYRSYVSRITQSQPTKADQYLSPSRGVSKPVQPALEFRSLPDFEHADL